MKSQAFKIPVGVLAFLCFGLTVGAQAQNTVSNHVTVTASDEAGSEMAPMLPAFDTAAFTIKRTGPTNQPLTVFYALSGTATAGTDYQALPGSVTIPAGAAEITVLVYPLDDTVYEPTETVVLTIQPSSAADQGHYFNGTPSVATVYIRDNDPAPPPPATLVPKGAVWKYWPHGTALAEGWKSLDYDDQGWPQGPGQLGFGDGDEATLLPGPQLDGTWLITAYFRHVFEMTNVAGLTNLMLDLLRDDGAVVYLNGVEIARDNLPAGAINYQTLATAAVSGADESRYFSRAVPSALLREGRNVLAVEVHQANVASTDLSFDLALRTAGEPPATNHPPIVTIVQPKATNLYTAPTNIAIYATATDPEGVPSISQVEFYADNVRLAVLSSPSSPNAGYYYYTWTNPPVGPHVLSVVAKDNQGAVGRAEVAVTVNSPVEVPVVEIAATDDAAREINPLLDVIPDSGQFTITRSGNTTEPLTVHYLIGGSASNGVDYAYLPRTVTIPAGQASATIAIDVLDDLIVEGDETVELALPNPNCCYRVGEKRSAKVTIHDDDRAPLPVVTVVATDAEAAEPRPVPPGMGMPTVLDVGEFTISRTGPTNEALRVFFRFSTNLVSPHVGVASNGVDFETIESPVTIPAGATSVVVQVIPIDDQLVELAEQVVLELHVPISFAPTYSLGTPASATVLIFDNEGPPVVTIRATDAEATEPNPLGAGPHVDTGQFTVYRTGPTNEALTVLLAIGGTAKNGVDYAAIPRSVTIPAGATSASIPVVPLGDNLREGTEMVNVQIEQVYVIQIWPPIPLPYQVGTPAAAEVRILDYAPSADHPPTVAIVSPVAGTRFIAPATIDIRAEARDAVDSLRLIEFFAGSQLLGVREAASSNGSFTLTWANVMPGEYSLTARATDIAGNAATSAPVRIVVNDRAPRVIRSLPAGYAPGMKFTVSLQATPTAQVLSWAVEDQPPAGWSVGAISDGGAYDATFGKVKFGPFLDNAVRTLTYEVTPPPDASGVYQFAGTASFDGVSQPIGGASAIGLRQHPADRNPADWRITMDELTAYSTAWRLGTTNDSAGGNPAGANNANPPISYVTRAGMLWKNGEYYTLDSVVTNPPLCWVSLPKAQANGLENPATPAEGTPEHCPAQSTMPANYQGGVAFTVSLVIQPKAGTSAYAVEETIPAGWVVANVSDNGWFQSATRKVRWGPFLDDATRTLTYTVVPAVDAPRLCMFQGVASFDGVDVPIAGRRVIGCTGATPPATINHADRDQDGLPVFTFVGEIGRTFVIEYSTDFLTWLPVKTATNHVGIITHTDVEAPALERRFYRARLLP